MEKGYLSNSPSNGKMARRGDRPAMPTRNHRFKLIVFNIEKNNNVGLLMRSAYAFGCDEVLLIGKTKYKVTGSAGTYSKLKQRHFFSLAEAVVYCKQAGFTIYGVEIGGTPLPKVHFDSDVAFILGNEGRGLAEAAPYCDKVVTIPQWGGVPSLNVAAAGAIVMYTFASQQGDSPAEIEGERYFDAFYKIPKTES